MCSCLYKWYNEYSEKLANEWENITKAIEILLELE